MAACFPETRVGGNWAVGVGGRASHALPGWWQRCFLWGHWHQRPAVRRGHAGVPTAGSKRGHVKFSTGAFSVHWVLLIPCPRAVFLPLPLLFVCLCVLIIRGLLACFPNPTLTFPSAPEKGGIPPAGKQSERPGRIPALCANPWGRGLCPSAKEENGRVTWAGQHEALGRHVVLSPSHPFYRWGSRVPEGSSDLHRVTQLPSEQNNSIFHSCYHKAFFSPGKHSA